MTKTKTDNWFAVDRAGMARVLARKSKATAIYELISNAWDEPGVDHVEVRLDAVPGRAAATLSVVDNAPAGFADLEEARVLFAPSKKAGDSEQRGRFNVGEKLFLALCETAEIVTTTGALEFLADGSVKRSRVHVTHVGTAVRATLKVTRDEIAECAEAFTLLLPPSDIATALWVDGERIEPSLPAEFATFDARLQTEIGGPDGLRPTERTTSVTIRAAHPDGQTWLYEMGVPVVEIDAPFNIDIGQKVPLTIDRENVKPAFLRRVLAHALNAVSTLLDKPAAEAAWITEALGSTNPPPTPETIERIMELRFGAKRVAYDPSDREGSQLAMSKGYTVVHGGALPAAAWTNVKATGALKPAGQVTPSNRAEFSADGKDCRVDPNSVPGAGATLDALWRLARRLTGKVIEVQLISTAQGFTACYGSQTIRFNLRRLGKSWFKTDALDERHLELLVHELGHEYCASHLDEGFHESQTRLGVKLAKLAALEGAALFAVTATVRS